MNFDLSDTDKKLVAAVEKVVADSGYPRKAAAEDTAGAGDSIRSAAAMLAACGYLTSGIDAGGDTAVGRMAAMETLAALDNRHFLPLEMSVRVAARLIDSFGSTEQKERHLAGLLAGSTIGALALSMTATPPAAAGWVAIRPEDIRILPGNGRGAGQNAVIGRVIETVDRGPYAELSVETDGQVLTGHLTRRELMELDVTPDPSQPVRLEIPPDAIHPLAS